MKWIATLLTLAACAPSPSPALPPPTTIAGDASFLLDAGPLPSVCALVCQRFAQAGCREANPACLEACGLAVASMFLAPQDVACLEDAGSRAALQACGAFCQ